MNDWQPYLDELAQRTQAAQNMGGEEKLNQQAAKGRLNARQRIDALCDPGSFSEMGMLVGGQDPAGGAALAGDGLVGGTGKLHGHTVVILAEDFTVKGGSIGLAQNGKRLRLTKLALDQKLPLILLLDGAGERATNAGGRYPFAPNDLQVVADLQGKVPVVTLLLGSAAGHGALTGMFADLIIINRGACVFTAGPSLVKASLGADVTAEQLGGAEMHTTVSGIAHNLCATEAEAFKQTRYFVELLQTRRKDNKNTQKRALDQALAIVPTNLNQAWNVHELINDLVDEPPLEVQANYGKSMITTFARIGGHSVLIVANQPKVLGGSITKQAAEKATHFLSVALNHDLPVIFLADNPGVMIGVDAEAAGTLKAAAAMYGVQRKIHKKVHVTLRKAFGFGSSIMGMNPFDHQLATLAFPNISLGALPAASGSDASNASDDERARLLAAQSGAWVPADNGAYDKVIDPRQLRNELLDALALGDK